VRRRLAAQAEPGGPSKDAAVVKSTWTAHGTAAALLPARRQEAVDRAAARIVLPFLHAQLGLRSLLHVGCGTGAWLAAGLDAGIATVRGHELRPLPLEASRVPRAMIEREPLAGPAPRFDLVVCTEVASAAAGPAMDQLAERLALRGDLLLLATAVAGEPDRAREWGRALERHGFAPVDAADAWQGQPTVAPWYARGLRLYASAAMRDRLPPAREAGNARAAARLEAEARWQVPPPHRRALGARPTVAVVIPCRDYGRFLKEAVESVAAQTWSELQCVVVDDGSRDDTAAVAEQLVASHPGFDLKVVRQHNTGIGGARNAGVRATSAPLVTQLDADDRLVPRAVERLVAAFLADADLDVAHCDACEFGAGARRLAAAPRVTLAALRAGNRLNYSALVRRTALAHVGGYRDIRSGYDDWDLWLSLAESGARFGHVPDVLLHYRRHADSLTHRESTRDLVLRAQVVLNHPDLYSKAQLRRASEVLERDTRGAAMSARRGTALALLRAFLGRSLRA